MRLITRIGVGIYYRELASLRYPKGRGAARRCQTSVERCRPLGLYLFSVDLARAAVRPFGRSATAASETLGWLLFRSRSAGILLRRLVVYLEGSWLAGIARY